MAKGKPVGSVTLDEEVMDRIVKFAFGPQKLSLKQTAEKTGVSEDSVRRVLKAYTLVGNGEEDEIIDRVAGRDMSMNHVTWAYNYYGYPLPEGIETITSVVCQNLTKGDGKAERRIVYPENGRKAEEDRRRKPARFV